MDDPKETNENTTPKEGQASSSEPGTPKETPTHTQAQVDEALQKDRIYRGRDDKALSDRETAVAAKEAEADRRQAERDAEELEAAQGNPDALSALELKRGKAELARDKAAHKADVDAAADHKRAIAIFEIATKYGVDADALKDLELDAEKTEAVAKVWSGKGAEAVDKDGKKIEKPDSGATIGGVGIAAMTADEKIAYGIAHPKK